ELAALAADPVHGRLVQPAHQKSSPGLAGAAGAIVGVEAHGTFVLVDRRQEMGAGYRPVASAISETCAMSGLQGNRISSSQPAAAKPAIASAICCGVVSALPMIRSTKSPTKP